MLVKLLSIIYLFRSAQVNLKRKKIFKNTKTTDFTISNRNIR